MICTLFTGQTSKEDIFIKYSYEFKKECVQLYREGKWPNIPEGSKEKNFHDSIRTWFKLEELHGPEILKHGNNSILVRNSFFILLIEHPNIFITLVIGTVILYWRMFKRKEFT